LLKSKFASRLRPFPDMNESPNPPSDELIAQLSRAWLTAQIGDEAPPEWVEDQEVDWVRFGNYAAMWRFVLRLCQDVSDDDDDTIGMIGAGPFWSAIHEWPDAALTAIEAETDPHPTLLRALSGVIAPTEIVERRIDAILARHGQGG
jgi:hypothetical protein